MQGKRVIDSQAGWTAARPVDVVKYSTSYIMCAYSNQKENAVDCGTSLMTTQSWENIGNGRVIERGSRPTPIDQNPIF